MIIIKFNMCLRMTSFYMIQILIKSSPSTMLPIVFIPNMFNLTFSFSLEFFNN